MTDTTKIPTAKNECRACLTEIQDDSLVDLFRAWDPPWSGMGVSIAEDLAKLGNIQIAVSDSYSKKICKCCCTRLKDAISFTLSVRNSDVVLRKRHQAISPLWPKPIQVDKSMAGSTMNETNVEIKQEVMSDEECDMNESFTELSDSRLEIKIEPEEITPAPHTIEIAVNGPCIRNPEKNTVKDGLTDYLDEVPFKKVQTLDRGKALVICVPSASEERESVAKPKKRMKKKLHNNEHSLPGNDRISTLCQQKNRNLTYDEAQLEMVRMQRESPGDEDERLPKKRRLIDDDMNELAVQCTTRLPQNVKEEPKSDDENENELDIGMPKDCMLCLKSFNTVKGLKAHVIAVHSYDSVKSSHVNRNVCATCNRGFATRTDLFVHETCHNKFACYVCYEKFDTFDLLTKHKSGQCSEMPVLPRLKTLDDVRRPLYHVEDTDHHPNSTKFNDGEKSVRSEPTSQRTKLKGPRSTLGNSKTALEQLRTKKETEKRPKSTEVTSLVNKNNNNSANKLIAEQTTEQSLEKAVKTETHSVEQVSDINKLAKNIEQPPKSTDTCINIVHSEIVPKEINENVINKKEEITVKLELGQSDIVNNSELLETNIDQVLNSVDTSHTNEQIKTESSNETKETYRSEDNKISEESNVNNITEEDRTKSSEENNCSEHKIEQNTSNVEELDKSSRVLTSSETDNTVESENMTEESENNRKELQSLKVHNKVASVEQIDTKDKTENEPLLPKIQLGNIEQSSSESMEIQLEIHSMDKHEAMDIDNNVESDVLMKSAEND